MPIVLLVMPCASPLATRQSEDAFYNRYGTDDMRAAQRFMAMLDRAARQLASREPGRRPNRARAHTRAPNGA